MPRLALKPDSSFFRKIVIGAVGTRAVCADLASFGHRMVELERGSTDTKLWKDVKRKRVRIPDLLCEQCGLRAESRAKTNAELAMSHSLTDEARAWDFGMVDEDYIAFPLCSAIDEAYWSTGRLGPESSYWHERNWVRWRLNGRINYFRVGAFRANPHTRISTKGVTEGSETSVSWEAIFSSRSGTVEAIDVRRLTIRRGGDGHRHTRTVPTSMQLFVENGEAVESNQVIAGVVAPLRRAELTCPGQLPSNHISNLLHSRERTQRFTGVKLARLLHEPAHCQTIEELSADAEEDVYIRLEALSYLTAVCGRSARDLFLPLLATPDPQTQLESVIALGQPGTDGPIELLSGILDDAGQPYFVRSAAAWCLSRARQESATTRLIRAFSDIDSTIRQEALEGIVSIGGLATPLLLAGLLEINSDIAAGCAEALRQQHVSEEVVARVVEITKQTEPTPWSVWLLGHLPRERVAAAIADLQESAPELHYAIALLWSFTESWIARRWELHPGPDFPAPQESQDAV